MPEYLAPGVYVEEVSFRSKSIEGVATSTTGFAGVARGGPVQYTGGPNTTKPRLITSYTEYERVYGGLQPIALASGVSSLGWFAVFYGLDWIATVPPTVRLTSEAFGRENTGVIYGWIGASHQLGASTAAFGAGAIRTLAGDYRLAFWIAGTLCVLAGTSFLTIGRRPFASRPSLNTVAAAGA